MTNRFDDEDYADETENLYPEDEFDEEDLEEFTLPEAEEDIDQGDGF